MSRDVARLKVVAGPDIGKLVELTGKQTVIGRGSKVDLPLNDRLLSREHARVFLAYDGWYVEDLKSTNGTWVDGQPVRVPVRLASGQRMRLGQSVLEMDAPAASPEAGFEQTMISYAIDPASMESLTIATDGPEAKVRREQEKLAAIYEVQGLLRANLPELELYERILAIIAKVVPCDVAYLLAFNEADGSLEPVAHHASVAGAADNPSAYISGSVVAFVKQHRQAVLSADADQATNINQTYVSGMTMNSILCVPLLVSEALFGMIYVMSVHGSDELRRDDLKLLSAIAQSAALAIENSRLVAENVRAARMATIGMTAAGLAHYVKNILTGLEGSISLLRLGMDSDQHRTMDAAWRILASNHRRLSGLMMDLLSLSKEQQLYFDRHNLTEIVKEVIELIENQVHDEHIRVDLELPAGDEALYAEVDNQGIHRVLLNLCNNAVDSVRQKHGETGEGRVRVSGFYEEDDETVVLSVTDNGLGIPPEEHEVIFESFHTTKGERGTGLGLAVCKRIVAGHRGQIWVDSDRGQPTAFHVRLPRSQVASSTACIHRLAASQQGIVPD